MIVTFKIHNPRDTYCLFHAIEMTRLHSIIGTADAPPGMTRQKFCRMLQRGPNHRRGRGSADDWDMKDYTLQLMDAIGAPRGLPDYAVEDWVRRISKAFDTNFLSDA